jgi:type I restriction enzyme, S subunit
VKRFGNQQMNKKYPNYKKTGLDWLEEIPVHWEILPNKALFIERKDKNNNDYELLSVTQDRGIIKQSEITIKKDISNDDKSNYKLVLKNDLAYNKMRMWQGAIGHSEYDGLVSPAYVVLKPKKNVFSRYFYYLFKSNKYLIQTNKFSYGLCDDMNSLRFEDFRNMVTPVPPYHEQELLSNVIELKIEEIENFISIKKKQIEKLKQLKIAIINKAVTKGLNPNAKMKDSGIEWLGEIPEHWEVRKIKNVSYVKGRIGWHGLNSSEYIDEGAYLVTGTDLIDNKINWNSCHHISYLRYEEDKFIQLKENDLLVTKDGTIGKTAIVNKLEGKATLNSGIFVVRPLKEIYLSNYLMQVINSIIFKLF